TGTGSRARCIFELQHFGPAVVVNSYCFHICHFCSSPWNVVRGMTRELSLSARHLRRERISRNYCGFFRNEGSWQGLESRTEAQLFAFLLKQVARFVCGLEQIAQIRQPHEPKGVLKVLFAANAESDPSRVGNPAVLFRKSFSQKGITDWAREGNINCAANVHMPDFCLSEKEFPPTKA